MAHHADDCSAHRHYLYRHESALLLRHLLYGFHRRHTAGWRQDPPRRGGDTISFDPQVAAPDGELTILIDGAQGRFRTTNWYITAVVTALSGILAYFVSGHALKPLRSFASQTEKVQLNNLADIRINENVLPEFQTAWSLPESDAGAVKQWLFCPETVYRQRCPRAAHTPWR